MIVPSGLVQQENVPIWNCKAQTGNAILEADGDAEGSLQQQNEVSGFHLNETNRITSERFLT